MYIIIIKNVRKYKKMCVVSEPAANNDLEYYHNDCNHKQGVNEASPTDCGCQTKNPKNQKYCNNSG